MIFIWSILLLIFAQLPQGGVTKAAGGAGPANPTLFQFLGKSGDDLNRFGSGMGINNQIWNLDSVGAMVPTSGSMIVVTGQWPNAPTTGGGYHANCTAPCSPAFKDSGGTSLTAVFTVGTACKDTGNVQDHNIWYEQNIASGLTSVKDNFPALIANNQFNLWIFYNVATTGGASGSSCSTDITPANNTAPNISGTAITGLSSGSTYLAIVQVDDQNGDLGYIGNTVNSITVPTGCTLTQANPSINGVGIASWTEYCILTNVTSFTPQFTISQTTHDTFSIYSAVFLSGSGGTAPGSTPSVLSESTTFVLGNSSNYTLNVNCPTGTTSLFITDDADSITSVTDSASSTWTHVQSGASANNDVSQVYYAVGTSNMKATFPNNTYTITLHTGASGNYDIPVIFCTNTTSLDTGFTASAGNTQTTSSTVSNSASGSSGGALGTYTNLPQGVPGHSGDLFIGICTDSNGPMLQPSQPAGVVADDPVPAALANIVGGDFDDYANGAMGGFHFYSTSTSAINWGWKMQNNTQSVNCQVTATF